MREPEGPREGNKRPDRHSLWTRGRDFVADGRGVKLGPAFLFNSDHLNKKHFTTAHAVGSGFVEILYQVTDISIPIFPRVLLIFEREHYIPRLATNSWYSQGCYCSPDPPASISQVQKLQACATTPCYAVLGVCSLACLASIPLN